MNSHSDECAIGIDGQLKDASEITWYKDPDDDDPLPPIPLNSAQQPEAFVHGTRRSIRARKPTSKVLAAAQLPAARTSTSTKGSAKHPVIESEDEERGVDGAMPSEDEEWGVDSNEALRSTEGKDDDGDEEEEETQKRYTVSKELGDQDRAVRTHFHLFFRSC